jgi:hypothetical protein
MYTIINRKNTYNTPVLGGARGPYTSGTQWHCCAVYWSALSLAMLDIIPKLNKEFAQITHITHLCWVVPEGRRQQPSNGSAAACTLALLSACCGLLAHTQGLTVVLSCCGSVKKAAVAASSIVFSCWLAHTHRTCWWLALRVYYSALLQLAAQTFWRLDLSVFFKFKFLQVTITLLCSAWCIKPRRARVCSLRLMNRAGLAGRALLQEQRLVNLQGAGLRAGGIIC